MTQRTQDFNRHAFPPIQPGSNQRKGMYLHLQGVEHSSKTFKALRGAFIRPNEERDLPVGAIIVQRRPAGTKQFSTWMWSYAFVPPQDEQWQWSPECEDDRFITFRDNVTAALQFAPRDEANGYLPDPELAAPINFPRPPGPETALAIARYAFANRPKEPPSVEEIARLVNSQPPDWLITLAAESELPALSALVAALAFVCEPETPEPTTVHREPKAATAHWATENEILSMSANTDGNCTARRRDYSPQERPKLGRRLIDALIPPQDEGETTMSLPEFRDVLNDHGTPK